MNSKLLKVKLFEKGMSYEDCSIKLGISKTAFSTKVNDINKFKVNEVNRLSELLMLTRDEKCDIFLN